MSVLDLFRLDGKIALITGGGRGLGAQIASAYAEAGATVVLCSRRIENCRQVKENIEKGGGAAAALTLDLTDPDSIRETVNGVAGEFGGVDILVNNAGASWGASALDMPYEAWQKVVQTNLTGTFLISQASARYMRRQGGGKILNIASIAGLRGTDAEILDAVGYNASKGAVITLTKDLAVKWARYNIYVNALAPGFFPSKMTKDLIAAYGDKIAANTPIGRLGDSKDLQGAALYFASPASDFTTGQILAIDGGATAK